MKEIGQTYRTVMENDDLDVEIEHLKRKVKLVKIQAVVLVSLALGTLIARLLV